MVPLPLTIIKETFSDDGWANVAFCFQVREPFVGNHTELLCYQRIIDRPTIPECLKISVLLDELYASTLAVSSGEKAWNRECSSPSEAMKWGVSTVVSGDTMSRIRRFDRSNDVVSLWRYMIYYYPVSVTVSPESEGPRNPLRLDSTREIDEWI